METTATAEQVTALIEYRLRDYTQGAESSLRTIIGYADRAKNEATEPHTMAHWARVIEQETKHFTNFTTKAEALQEILHAVNGNQQ
jgi:hypothetical protein